MWRSPRPPLEISKSERGHGRSVTWTLRVIEASDAMTSSWPETSWILERHSNGSRDGNPFDQPHTFLKTLRTSTEALLCLGPTAMEQPLRGSLWLRKFLSLGL